MTSASKPLEQLMKRVKTSADNKTEGDTESLSALKQALGHAKSAIKETHKLEQAGMADLGNWLRKRGLDVRRVLISPALSVTLTRI